MLDVAVVSADDISNLLKDKLSTRDIVAFADRA
jgi:hypothetical protein